MTRRETVINAINHKESVNTPYSFFGFAEDKIPELQAHFGCKDVNAALGNYLHRCGKRKTEPIPGRPGFFIDNFNVVWNRTRDKNIGVVETNLLEDAERYDEYVFPTPDERFIRGEIEETLKTADDKFVYYNFGFSLFERAWMLRGMENLLMDFIEDGDFVHRFFGDILKYDLAVLDIVLGYDRIDGVLFGDDWGQQKGLIMGAPFWREYIKPCARQLYAKVKAKSKYAMIHSCGDIEELFPELIESGLDIYQTVQPEIYDLAKIKKEYGQNLTFWGALSTQYLLVESGPAEVERITRQTIDLMKPGGGYIAGPTHTITADVPLDNILAMLKGFKES